MMDIVRKGFGKKASQGFNKGEEESWGIWRVSYVKIVDESILFYSKDSLSKFCLEALYLSWV